MNKVFKKLSKYKLESKYKSYLKKLLSAYLETPQNKKKIDKYYNKIKEEFKYLLPITDKILYTLNFLSIYKEEFEIEDLGLEEFFKSIPHK